MKRLVSAVLFLLLSANSFSEITTQYPGCPPDNSTATELDIKPIKYYPTQKPLNEDAIKANEALRKQ